MYMTLGWGVVGHDDITKLLTAFERLIDNGGSLLVIEHNLDVIKTADWIVDLGPEGGSGGGKVIACGTPEQIAAHELSHTGHYLAPILERTKTAENKVKSASRRSHRS